MSQTIRIVDPTATAVEVAALVAVLAVLQPPATPGQGIPSEWPVINRMRNAHLLRPRSWRANSAPR